MKSYKFKIRRPSKAVVTRFEQTLNICRELYNAALQERRDAWRLNQISISYLDQQNVLPQIKAIREDVAVIHSQVLQDVLRRLDKTFKAFFGRVKQGEKIGFPRFKGANRYDSFCFPQAGFKLEEDKLTLSKIGSMRIRLSREIKSKIKTCAIKREADGWYVIFVVENEKEILPKTGKAIGIDVGIKTFAKFSNGKEIPNPTFLRQAEKRLKRAQRFVSRKKKGSKKRRKAIILLRKQHFKIKRQRLDFLHKESLKLVREFDEIKVEKLNIRGMVKNHHLAKSITDAAWGSFLNILECKAENAGKRVLKVNPSGTSQNCSRCGIKVPKTLSQRIHNCPSCGLVLDRDENAAINILTAGLAVSALTKTIGL